jgi:hypothetical protein
MVRWQSILDTLGLKATNCIEGVTMSEPLKVFWQPG